MKTFDTLFEDIEAVLGGSIPPAALVHDDQFKADTAVRLFKHLENEVIPADRSTRASNEVYVTQFSSPCWRKSWYQYHNKGYPEKVTGSGKFKFLYGDLIEESFLYLCKAAGHNVEHSQVRLEFPFQDKVLVGRPDAVIDNILVDIKSCDPYTFEAAVKGKYEDKWGYGAQLFAYANMLEAKGILVQETCIIFINKVNGKFYFWRPSFARVDFTTQLAALQFALDGPSPVSTVPTEPEGTSGNKVISKVCSYCPYKFDCFPSLRVFAYSDGPKFFSHVVKEPKVVEYTGAYKASVGLS